MVEVESIAKICENNPVMLLLRRKHIGHALEVAHRVFRDEYSLSAPLDRFLRICAIVKDELYPDDDQADAKKPPLEQLEIWCDKAKGEPWFAMHDDIKTGKTVSMRPAARKVLEVALNASEDNDLINDETMGVFFDDLIQAGAHLRKDQSSVVDKYKHQIEDLQRKVDAIERQGVTPPTDEDRAKYASMLTQNVRRIITELTRLPAEMRENLTEATDLFYTMDDTHGQVLKAVYTHLVDARQRPRYRVMDGLATLHNQEARRKQLELAVETIIEHCRDHVPRNARIDARNFFENFTDVALRTVSEDQQAAERIKGLLDEAVFDRRRGQSRRLMKLAETMREAARTRSLSLRNGSLPFRGFVVSHEKVSKNYWFDLRLTPSHPVRIEDPAPVEELQPIDPEVARKAIQEAAEKEAHIDPSRLARRIDKLVSRHGALPLSSIIRNFPLKYGIEELTSYMHIAAAMAPAEFRPEWALEVCVPGLADANIGQRILCADPVFTPDGAPGRGLENNPDPKPQAYAPDAARKPASMDVRALRPSPLMAA